VEINVRYTITAGSDLTDRHRISGPILAYDTIDVDEALGRNRTTTTSHPANNLLALKIDDPGRL
jgi:hypothetical protein